MGSESPFRVPSRRSQADIALRALTDRTALDYNPNRPNRETDGPGQSAGFRHFAVVSCGPRPSRRLAYRVVRTGH
jgi:hypothetical protein